MAKHTRVSHAGKSEASPAPRASREERFAAGKLLRNRVPREDHGTWKPPRDRPSPVELVIASSKGRIAQLVPIRYGRMSVSAFTFYRGTALNMASDLAATPSTGVRTHLCGDCHLMNFGGFATPERRIIFDINDFDETLHGPWEWDLKRLAASFVLAARSNAFAAADQRKAAMACVRSYRERVRSYAKMPSLDVWYARIDKKTFLASLSDADTQTRLRKRIAEAEARTVVETDFPNLVEGSVGKFVIKDNPPLIYHDQAVNLGSDRENVLATLDRYRTSLQDDRRVLFDRYQVTDISVKVVGVGSVGTFCAVLLMMAENDDPLLLQVKEARASVLERYLGKSRYANHGQRIVVGQRLMQSASDIFLGWAEGKRGRHFYVRQLRDMKLKPLVEIFDPTTMLDYAALCGWTLARAHARSGDAALIAGYAGKSEALDEAITRFSMRYADQAERDHAALMSAIRKGRIEAQMER
jgi:uncharacterized protein (DUF2252 family)